MTDEQWRAWADAEDRIFRAAYAAAIAGVGTLILTGMVVAADPAPTPGAALVTLDAAVTLALAWALHHWRSRAAAAILVGRAVFMGVGYWERGYVVYAALSAGLFGLLYLQGLRGTLTLRRLAPLRAASSPATALPPGV